MARPAGLGKKDFRNNSTDDIVGPSTVLEIFIGGVTADVNFTDTATNPPPRFMTCEADGTLIVTDWTDNAVTLSLQAGQVRAFRPKTITSAGSTATVTLEW